MLQDIRFAIRTLVKAPAFTITAVLCLALGIGVNATIFSCVRAMLRPFPYQNPDGLVAIGEANTRRGWHMNTVSYPNFRSWQADNRSLSNVGVYTGTSYNLASSGGAEFVPGGNVSWTMFRTLGVAPALGRDFKEEEDRVGAPSVIILSDRLWHDRFGGRRDGCHHLDLDTGQGANWAARGCPVSRRHGFCIIDGSTIRTPADG